MTATLSLRPRRARLQRVLIALAAVAMVLAILPILAAIIMGVPDGASGSAFAQAPSGQYAVVSRTVEPETKGDDEIDIVSVVNAGTGEVIDVATVPHLTGFAPSGTVAPNGKQLALVVPDAGTATRPLASLLLVDLESGVMTPLATEIDALQRPVWAASGDAIVAATTTMEAERPAITLNSVSTGGVRNELFTVRGALGVYPVGFDAEGRLVNIRIDGEGSTVYLDDTKGRHLGPHITRDWSLSPAGKQIAYIEVNQENGVSYLPRVVDLDGGDAGAQAVFTQASEGEALGSTWVPNEEGRPAFGTAPNAGDGVAAQALSGGFDIPLEYSRDGSSLAVKHWSGTSFDAPGAPSIELVTETGREPLPGMTRFFGWATR